jgi:DNA-binding PadR family transcriptional regulator
MSLSREQIERLMGKQPPLPKIKKQTNDGWVPTTREERERIRKIYRDNPTYTLREISAKTGRSNSVIWKIIKTEEK